MKTNLSIGLKFIDIFAQPVQITFNKEKKFSTVLGGLLSLAIYGVTFSLIYTVGLNMLNRKNPKTTMTESYEIISPLVNLTEIQMILTATILTKNFELIADPSIFTVELFQFIVKLESDGNKSFNYKTLNQIDCTDYSDFFKNKGMEEKYKSNNLDKGICFDVNQADLLIGGNFNTDYFSNILFRVNKCQNSTNSNITCQSEEVINEKLQGGYFQFYYINYNIDINEYLEPFKEYFSNYFILLDPLATKFVDIFYKVVDVESDGGLIFEEPVINSTVVFDYYREQIDTSTGGNKIIDFYVNSSNNHLRYKRIYSKFQDLAATVGGLIKVMMILGYFSNIVFSNHKMYEKMFIQLFQFKDDIINENSNNKHNPNNIRKNFPLPILNKNDFSKSDHPIHNIDPPISNNYFKNENQFSNSKKIENINSAMTKFPNSEKTFDEVNARKNIKEFSNKINCESKLNFEPFQIIKMYCYSFCRDSKQKKKLKIFNLAFDKLNRYLDYLEIIKTLQQFHKLKKVVFTKNQQNLFNFQKKPEISLEKTNRKTNIKFHMKNQDEEEYLELHKNYLKSKTKANKINKRLLKNLDGDLKDLFENL